MSTPVLGPEILNAIDKFDNISKKPAELKKYITQKYKKDISYA
jgi:hypothetical protein